jgi:lysylphosphatidylglycerol synthase-like protein
MQGGTVATRSQRRLNETVDSPEPSGGSPRRGLRLALLSVGAAAFVLLFGSVGWPAVASNLARIGGWFAVLVLLYTLAQGAFTVGWLMVFEPGPRRPSLMRLFAVYLAGDAFNYLAPGGVAGEPLKARMLPGVPGTGAAVAALTIHKHADLASQWVFAAAGVAVAFWRFPLPLAAKLAALAGVAGLGGLLVLMSWGLNRGTYSPVLRGLARWKFLADRLDRFHSPARDVDERIRSFYRRHPGRFAASAAWCFLGWCGGLVETRIALALLSPGSGWDAAFAIEALAMVLNNMFLFIPGRIGSAEGIRVGIFLLLGLGAGPGAAYSLVRRGRELVWTIPGLAVFFRWQAERLRPAPVRGVS